MRDNAVIFYVRDKRFQPVQPQEVSLETMGETELLPKGFPENLSILYYSVQNRLRWEKVLLEYQYVSDSAFDIFSLVPGELKEQDFLGDQLIHLKDCCQLLGVAGEVLLKVPRREVLYVHNGKEITETVEQEGISVRDAMRQCAYNTIYAVLYCQYLCGQLTAAILHIDREGKALRLPE